MQIHLDALGGAAGDMFVAALLDAFPQYLPGVLASVAKATMTSPVSCHFMPHNDGVLQGHRFDVSSTAGHDDAPSHSHTHSKSNGGHSHTARSHRHWSEIRVHLEGAHLDADVLAHAIAIFEHLARAEAQVHGIAVEDVAFHEVGAWDSIADIVAASHLIAEVGATGWSVGPLPLGSGRVMSDHGPLPVPAPATAILLQGFITIEDGISGERVTPTGAAILRHLCPGGKPDRRPRILGRSGTGFGSKVLPGISNCLRVLVFDQVLKVADSGHRELAVIEFEVDDQSAEDLAMGLDRLRQHPDVFDVVQMCVFGKKGRMMAHVRALARAAAVEAAISACFRETTTIGLRHHIVSGAALAREVTTVEVAGRTVRVKTVERPGGRTAKAEADDALAHETHAARATLRREAEQLALTMGRTP